MISFKIIGFKRHMLSFLDEDNSTVTPCTVINLDFDIIKYINQEYYIGYKTSNKKRIGKNKKWLNHYSNFTKFTSDKILTKQDIINLILESKLIHIRSLTKGKGTLGVMQRWGFKGGPASHGATKCHRAGGSYGQDTPNRILRLTKMPGKNLPRYNNTVNKVIKIENINNQTLLYVAGSVSGPKNNKLEISL